jgi:gliding motility-associated-like protein
VDTVTISVTEPETVFAGPDLATCLDSVGYLINGFTPKLGIWTGAGMAGTSDSTFNPRAASLGVHELVYTVGEGLCLRRDTTEITVNPLPFIDAGGNQDTICINDDPFDLDLVSGASAEFGGNWSIISSSPAGASASLSPDGIFNPNPTGFPNIPQAFTYNILCRTVNPLTGCDSTDTKWIIVNPRPEAEIRGLGPAIFCVNEPIRVASISRSSIPSLSLINTWSLDNGSIISQWPNQDSLLIAFPDTGIKVVRLSVRNNSTCEDIDSILIHIIDRGIPKYGKVFNPTSQCGPLTVTFTDSSTGFRIETAWDFGDGNFVLKPKVFNQFFPMSIWQDTLHPIRFRIINQCDTSILYDTILVKTLPVANISANGLTHCPEPNLVTFSSSVIGAPTSMFFDFGDGTTQTIAVNPLNFQELVQHGYVNNTMNDLFFTVKVTAFNTCPSSTDSIKIRIRGRNFNYELTADDTVHCDNGITNFSTSPMVPGVTVRWDLGDGTIVLNQKDVSHEYNLPGVYRVKLTSFNDCHRMVDSAWVHVYASPLALIVNAKDTSICMEDTILFMNGSSPGLSYEWYKNNETSPWAFSYQAPVIQLAASGITKIKLIVKDPQSGCSAIDSAKVTVRPGLRTRAKIEAIPNEICPGDTILIRDLSENRQSSEIYTGDSFSHLLGPTKTELKYPYFTPGTYSLYLIAFGQCVNDTSEQVQIKVNPVPRVGFLTETRTNSNWSDTVYICVGDSVWYSNLFPTQSDVNYSWNFGDNTGSSSISPQPKQYNVAGLYLTTLKVVASGPAGCDSTKSIWVKVKSLPNAIINGNNNTVCQNGILSFQNASTNYIQHRWKVLDPGNFEITPPSQEYNQTINLQFNQAGSYTIRLITSNTFGDEGCRDSVDKQVTVFPAPIANIEPDTSFACLGDFVQFSNQSSVGMAYLWRSIGPPFVTWTNGINQFTPGPTPNFNSAGIYRFELRVTDPVSGCKAYDTAFVDVNSIRQAAAAWTITPLEGCDSLKITIRDNSVFRDSSRVWFSNGTVLSIPRPQNQTVVKFFQADTLQAYLVAYGKCTFDTTASETIRIRRSPKANFRASTAGNPEWIGDTITICLGETVQFINLFSGIAGIEHNWVFGDGGLGSAQESPLHTYNQTGLFQVVLKETYLDPPFCQASKRKWVLVKPQPQAVFTGPVVACEGIPLSFQSNSLFSNKIRWFLLQGSTKVDSADNIPVWSFAIQSAGNYFVRLEASGLINSSGCTSLFEKPLLVHPKPNSNFTIQKPSICLNDSLQVLNSSESGMIYSWYLANSSTPFSSLFNPAPIRITTAGLVPIRLKVTNPITTCYSWDTATLTVSNVKKTIAKFQVIPPYQGCDSLRVKFRNLSVDADSAWVLLGYNNLILPFSPGNSNAAFTYPDTGKFQTRIIAEGQCNRDTSEGPSIRIWPSPKVGFYASTMLQPNWITDTIVICVNDTVRFHNSLPLQSAVHYRWKFSESGTIFNGINPDRRNYLNSGYYAVTLQAISDSGACLVEARKIVRVKPLPTLSLNISPSSVCVGSEVVLDGTNTQNAEFFRWEITEGDFVTTIDTAAPIIQYTFLQAGNGNTSIRLIAYNSASRNSCFSEITKSVVVRPKPVPRITLNDSSGCTPLTISFSRNPENFGGQESVSWNFGDNRTSTSANLSLTPLIFTNPDTLEKVRTIKLKVSYQGCVDSSTRKVRIFPVPKPGLPFVNGFGPIISQANPILKMQEEVTPICSQWVRYYDFGDGKDTIIIGGPNTQIEHRYDTTGTYTVTQKVMDWRYPDTCSAVFEQNFISVIQSPPIAEFKVNGKDSCSVCEDDTVTFTNKSRFVTQSSFWNFGNGRTLRLTGNNRYQSQKIVYPEPGVYQVSLSVKNERGVDTVVKKASVIVNPKPNTAFTISPNIFEYPIFKDSDPIRTVNATTGGAKFYWNFGEIPGDTLAAFDTTYRYTIPGAYTISLVSISELGCLDTFRLQPTLNAFMAGLWVPDAFSPNGDGLNDDWQIFHINVNSFQLFVYNQWGEQIFYSTDPEKRWDGTFEGAYCPNGGYSFHITYTLNGLKGQVSAPRTISKVVTLKR